MYKEIYEGIIERAKTRSLKDCYFEKHHIVPRHKGGTNDEENLVDLTYREHRIVHFLLYKLYKNPEDKCAYVLMYNVGLNRKLEIGKMIGEKHKLSGHIQKLGQLNKETGWINRIKTKESLSKGGKKAGMKAKLTGQIHAARTPEGSLKGGITAGKLAKERNQIQNIAKYKGAYVLIMPDGKEFLHAFQAAKYMNVSSNTISQRCYSGALGYSRRPKKPEEMGMNGVLSSEQD